MIDRSKINFYHLTGPELRSAIEEAPTVPAVPLDKLCEWMADNVYLKDDTEAAWELNSDNWEKVLTTWMEEQDADRS